VWCISRCICCGKDLVCCCCRCCGRDKGHKHLDSAPSTPYNQQGQYQSHGAPVYAGPGAFSQTATFDGATKVHADSLPAMPSWDTAASRKVEVIEEAAPESHEMDRLRTNASPAPRSDTTSPLARPIPMQDRGSPYGSRTDLSNPAYGGAAAARPAYGEENAYGSGAYTRPPRSPAPGGRASPSPYGPSTPNDRYGAGASPYGASPYGGSASYGGNAQESANPYGGSNAYGGSSGGNAGYGNSGGYGASSSPYGNTQSPYGGNASGGANAYGGSNAYGGNSNAYGNNNRYDGGGNASSSPYGQYNNSRPAGNGWRDI
jgi:hypothetical protein